MCLGSVTRLLLAASLMVPTIARAQGPAEAGAVGRVAVLEVALYTAGANLQEATDTAVARLATQVLGGKLRELLGASVLDSGLVGRASRSDSARSITGGDNNLIWLFTGQLVNVGPANC
jgi:hypothetical protein